MKIFIETDGKTFTIDTGKLLSIAIPVDFYGGQPNAYGVERASSKACEAGELIGDTRRGGSCNFEQITMIPHCNGTHTESVGHITNERISVNDCLRDAFLIANLISVKPERAGDSAEGYAVKLNETDELITEKSIKNALEKCAEHPTENFDALIIRTLPNDKSKLSKTYSREIPPFFSTDAMRFIRSLKIKHLLCDLPSIDRIFDEGKLSNHRIFWNVEEGSFEINSETFLGNTITEMIYVSNEIKDGSYLLNLQIAPFVADAAPSRPVLFELNRRDAET